MPVHYINTPDGKRIEVTAPDGASQEEIVAYAQKMYAQDRRPQAVADQPSNPTDGMSTSDKLLAGVGSSFVNTGDALKQTGLWAGNKLGFVDQSSIDAHQAKIDEERRMQAPLMNTKAGLGGNIFGNVAQGVAGGSLLAPVKVAQGAGLGTKVLGSAANAGIFTGLTMPTATGEDPAMNMMQGAAFGAGGQAIGSGVARVAKGASDKISPMAKELYEKAQAMGIPVTASQLSDSRVLKWLASITKDIPFSGAGAANRNQVDQFTRAASRTVGQDTDELSPSVMGKVKGEIDYLYENAFKDVDVKLDSSAYSAYQSLVSKFGSKLTPDQRVMFGDLMKQFQATIQGGKMPGQVYQEFRKVDLDDIIASNPNAYGQAVKGFREILDGAAKRSLPKERIDMFNRAQTLYRNKKVVDKSLSYKDGMDVKTRTQGKINPATFDGAAGSKYKPTQEIDDLGRIGQLIKDPAPNSGTVPRQIIGGGLLASGGVATGGAGIAPVAGGLAAGALAGRVLNSPMLGKYVARGMPEPVQKGAGYLEKALPRLGGPVAAGFVGGAPMIAPQEFDKQIQSGLSSGRLTKEQAASEIDSYLQTISKIGGFGAGRELYKQFPQWASIMAR